MTLQAKARVEIRNPGGNGPALSLTEADIYFAFTSGVFSYDCLSCGSQCCRGHSYRLEVGQELDHHLRRNTSIRYFTSAEKAQSGLSRGHLVHNWQPACFFLSDEGLCRVQTEAGHDAKPETCRLFPFNHFRLVGSTLLVAPHLNLCPLGVSASLDRTESRHGVLFDEMARQGLGAPIQRCNAPSVGNAEAMALERELLASEPLDFPASAGFDEFVDRQLSITAKHFPSETTPLGVPGSKRILQTALSAWPSEAARSNAELIRVLEAAAPSIRAKLVFLTDPIGKIHVPLGRVPYALLALHTIAALAVDAGMSHITYQTLTKMLVTYEPLILLLAVGDVPHSWTGDASVDFSPLPDPLLQPTYLGVAKDLLRSRQIDAKLPVAELLGRVTVLDDGFGALSRATLIAQRLFGKLEPLSAEPSRHRRRTLRTMAQRTALKYLDGEVLQRAISQTMARR